MSITFVHAPGASSVRRLNVRLPDTTWQLVDRLISESETSGTKIDLEATLAQVIESLVRSATGTKRGRKAGGGNA